MRFSLLSEESCELRSTNGKCIISLLAEDDYCKSLRFYSELVLQKESGHDDKNDYMKQLVLNQVVKQKRFIFEVRLPHIGTYWFRLFVTSPYLENVRRKCCEFKIICNEAYASQYKTLPPSKGLDVFGFTKKAAEAGLANPSKDGAKIRVKPSNQPVRETLVSFVLDEATSSDIEYDSEMFGSDSVDEALTGN